MQQASSPISNTALSPLQVQVAQVLASGSSISNAARSCNVGRTTIYTWLRTSPEFYALVQAATTEFALTLRDQLQDYANDAVGTVGKMITDPQASCAVRLRAALAILNRPTFPDKGWALPVPIGTPTELRQQEIVNFVQADLKAMRYENEIRKMTVAAAEEAAAGHAAAVPQNGTIRNNSEQKTQIPDSVPPPPLVRSQAA